MSLLASCPHSVANGEDGINSPLILAISTELLWFYGILMPRTIPLGNIKNTWKCEEMGDVLRPEASMQEALARSNRDVK